MLSEYTEYSLLQEDNRIAQETKSIIVLTSCNYLFSGLSSIISTDNTPFSHKLIHVRTLNEALNLQKLLRSKVILVAPESSTPSEIIMAKLTIFKTEHMMREHIIPKATCLLIDTNLKVEVSDTVYQLRKNSVKNDLKFILKYYLDKPRQQSQMNKNWLPLT
ncbi:MAG: hypothetical protein E6009_13505, partial [Citrobacter freundii]|nr:hypothetical protein [Citrobacter freundii]